MVIKDKRDGESNESLIRGWTRAVRSGGFTESAKQHQTFERKPNKNQQRKSAQQRRISREQREHDIKTGKLVVPTQSFRRKG